MLDDWHKFVYRFTSKQQPKRQMPQKSNHAMRRQRYPVLGKPRDMVWPAVIERETTRELDFSPLLQHQDFADFLQNDDVPIPAPEDRESHYPGRDHIYWLSGLHNYLNIRRSLPDLPKGMRVLDFGGATGRVSRHFITPPLGADLTIAECNIDYVDWVNTHFGDNGRAVWIDSDPYFPLPDNSFDFALGISIFTHIDADEIAWLKELVRVLKPDGYMYLTILDEQGWMTADKDWLRSTVDSDFFPVSKNPNITNINKYYSAAIGGPMPAERFSVRTSDNAVNNCNTYHSSDYIKRAWNKWVTVERIEPRGHGDQSAVILKNDKKSF